MFHLMDCRKLWCLFGHKPKHYQLNLSGILGPRWYKPPICCPAAGELVGARLISHAGSLLNLAKMPASTIQILGAEKALFRALKTRKDTPKYGLLFHASLVGQAGAANKGKMARMLAAKAALALRVDALAEDQTAEVGVTARLKVWGGTLRGSSILSALGSCRTASGLIGGWWDEFSR